MSCLFDSLQAFIRGVNLRHEICSFLQRDPILIEPDLHASTIIQFQPDVPSSSLAEYIRVMSMPNTNGGAIEIFAFCLLFKKNVRVLQCGARQGGAPIEFVSNQSYHWVTLSWNGGHYEPIQIIF